LVHELRAEADKAGGKGMPEVLTISPEIMDAIGYTEIEEEKGE